MKPLLFCISLLLLCSWNTEGQIEVHLKGGLNSQDLTPGDLLIFSDGGTEAFTFKLKESKFGYHVGIDFKFNIGNLFLMPEVLFSTSEVHYTFAGTSDTSLIDQIFKEHYNYLDIPFNVGMDIGPLAIFVGPVGHVYLNSSSDLLDVEHYGQTFESVTYGWNAGVGLSVGRFGLQARYESNFSAFGDHFIFFGDNYQFSHKPSRLLGSLVIKF